MAMIPSVFAILVTFRVFAAKPRFVLPGIRVLF